MGALDDFLTNSQPETKDKAFKINPKVQQERDQGRMQILQAELDQNTTDLNSPDTDTRRRAQANIEMLRREMGGSKQPAKTAQSTSALDDFLNQSQELGPPIKVESSGGVKAGSIPQVPPTQTLQEPSTLTKLGRTTAGLADTVIGGIQALPGAVLAETGYAGVRALEGLGLAEPGRAERGREAVYKEFVEPFTKPVGQTAGVTETPEYKGEASQQTMQFIGENLDKGADWISAKTGIPKTDVLNMMNTLMTAAPAVVKPIVKKAKTVIQDQFAAKKSAKRAEPVMQPEAAPPTEPVSPEPTSPTPQPTERQPAFVEPTTQKTNLQDLNNAYQEAFNNFQEKNKNQDFARASNNPETIERAAQEWKESYSALKNAREQLEAAQNAETKVREQTTRPEPTATTVETPVTAAEQLQNQLQQKKGQPFEMPMAGVGAARTADAATLAEAVARATPEIKADLAKVKPGDLNVDALNRVMDADQLPVPVRLTRGQASQDPVIISNERNQRGIKDQVVAHLNEQNKALQENANLMKERVAPDVNTTSFVEDAERSIDLMGKRIKTDDDAITAAYNSLKDYGAGKLEVDSQSFGNNAKKALGEFDEQEFLPSSILSRINSYAEGKPMNFNQFENLRTVLARETRKAQAANDGNAVHALTVVRSELEKMPLLNETGDAKVLADKARSLAKSQFDLLDKKRDTYNPLYADVMNGIADTKDFIPKLVFRSKNKDFVKTMETLAEGDPQAVQHLRSGALDYMIRESTDASGNFLTGKFNKLVDNLDVNKKLDALFGDEAKTIRAIASTGKIVEARPKGSFVNESNTAVAAAQMAKQYGAELLKNIPGVKYFVEPASQVLQQRQLAKEVKQTIKPAAGVRLSDIGKKK